MPYRERVCVYDLLCQLWLCVQCAVAQRAQVGMGRTRCSFPVCVPTATPAGAGEGSWKKCAVLCEDAGGEGLVLGGTLTLQLSVLSAVPHVLRTSIIASHLLYGNGDPDCGGYTATEENGGDRGCASE